MGIQAQADIHHTDEWTDPKWIDSSVIDFAVEWA
jgi:hypothetical protein